VLHFLSVYLLLRINSFFTIVIRLCQWYNKSRPSSPLRLNVNIQQQEFEDGVFIVKEPNKFRNEIQELMKHNAGLIREETKLQNGLKRILELKKEFYSTDNILKGFKIDDGGNSENVVLTSEVKSSLVVCKNVIRSALMRQEQRSSLPFWADYPKIDEEKWNVNIL
jgi:succinate dehydrogenase/fumarate reductase flavoprotein subunit